MNSQFTLLYDNNKDSIANIALLSKEGYLLESVPAARLKTGLDVTEEEWFGNTLARTDFSKICCRLLYRISISKMPCSVDVPYVISTARVSVMTHLYWFSFSICKCHVSWHYPFRMKTRLS